MASVFLLRGSEYFVLCFAGNFAAFYGEANASYICPQRWKGEREGAGAFAAAPVLSASWKIYFVVRGGGLSDGYGGVYLECP